MDPIQALGWTLLHFIWQGALIAAGLALTLTVMGRAAAQTRYAISCIAMLMLLVVPAATFGVLSTSPVETNLTSDTQSPMAPIKAERPVQSLFVEDSVTTAKSATPVVPAGTRLRNVVERILPWIVAFWSLGAVVGLIRLGVGSWNVRRLRRRGTQPVPAVLQRDFDRLVTQLRIARRVRLILSTWVTVPTVTGWIRPAVIVPTCALTGLSPEQLEAVLAHELAHIRRHDYLVNLLQIVVESLLFYHPAVWWVSRQVRAEREHSCDDVAVATCGDALTYARALTALELSRAQLPALALAANGGSLLHRIRRLAGEDVPARPAALPALVAMAVLTAGALAIGNTTQAETRPEKEHPAIELAVEHPNLDHSHEALPAGRRNVRRTNDDGEVLIEVDDGRRRITAELFGQVTLSRDLTSIEELSSGGRLRIAERRRGDRLELLAVQATATRLDLTYRVDDRAVPFDDEGKAWLAEVLPILMRSGAVGAKAHARRLVDEGEERELLREIDRLESNSVRRIFYETLLVEGQMSDSRRLELIERASDDITSNSNRAALYRSLAQNEIVDGDRLVEIAGEAINSNSTMSKLLLDFLASDRIDATETLNALDAYIDSQSTRASAILSIAESHGRDARVREAILESLDGFNSNSTLAKLLTDLEARDVLSTDEAMDIAVREINSNSTLAKLLKDRAAAGSLDAEEVLDIGARHINSASTYSDLIYRVAVINRDDPRLENLLRRYVREISSKSTRTNLIQKLEREGLISGSEGMGVRKPPRSKPAKTQNVQTVMTASRTRTMSDSERASHVLRVAESDPNDPQIENLVDRQLESMASNSAMASMLLGLEQLGALEPERVRELAIENIGSNSTRASLFLNQLERGTAEPEDVLVAATTLESESTRASVVRNVARRDPGDPRTRDAVVETLPTFTSSSTLASLLLQLDDSELISTEEAVGLAADHLVSNSTLASLLGNVQRNEPNDPSIRAAVKDAYGAIVSHSTLANALERSLADGYFDPVETIEVAAAGLREWDGISRSGVWENGVQIESYPDPLETFVARLADRYRGDASFRNAYQAAVDTMQTPDVRIRLMQYISN